MKKFKSISISLIMAVLMISLSSSIPISNDEPILEKKNASEQASKFSNMTYKEFLSFSSKDYFELKGTKMSFKQRMALRMAQRNLKKEIKNNSIDENSIMNYDEAMGNGESSFKIGGFLLGFFLGLIGVGLAYIFSSDSDFIKSTWKGLGAWVILLLVLVLI